MAFKILVRIVYLNVARDLKWKDYLLYPLSSLDIRFEVQG